MESSIEGVLSKKKRSEVNFSLYQISITCKREGLNHHICGTIITTSFLLYQTCKTIASAIRICYTNVTDVKFLASIKQARLLDWPCIGLKKDVQGSKHSFSGPRSWTEHQELILLSRVKVQWSWTSRGRLLYFPSLILIDESFHVSNNVWMIWNWMHRMSDSLSFRWSWICAILTIEQCRIILW